MRIGVAVSDETKTIAQPHSTIVRRGDREGLDRILGLVRELAVEEIVVGLPRRLDGSEGDSAREARRLGQRLAELSGLPVSYCDERLTTLQAERELRDLGAGAQRRRHLGDQVVAALILQQHLTVRARGTR